MFPVSSTLTSLAPTQSQPYDCMRLCWEVFELVDTLHTQKFNSCYSYRILQQGFSKSVILNKLTNCFKALWHSDIIGWHITGPTSVQAIALCLTAPSHYLNQCWLIIREVLWCSSKVNFTGNAQENIHKNLLKNCTFILTDISAREHCIKGHVRYIMLSSNEGLVHSHNFSVWKKTPQNY